MRARRLRLPGPSPGRLGGILSVLQFVDPGAAGHVLAACSGMVQRPLPSGGLVARCSEAADSEAADSRQRRGSETVQRGSALRHGPALVRSHTSSPKHHPDAGRQCRCGGHCLSLVMLAARSGQTQDVARRLLVRAAVHDASSAVQWPECEQTRANTSSSGGDPLWTRSGGPRWCLSGDFDSHDGSIVMTAAACGGLDGVLHCAWHGHRHRKRG